MTALRKIVGLLKASDGALHYDLPHHRDAHGCDNLMAVGYWRDPAAHCRWLQSSAVSAGGIRRIC
jgi:aldoxime dehydratase